MIQTPSFNEKSSFLCVMCAWQAVLEGQGREKNFLTFAKREEKLFQVIYEEEKRKKSCPRATAFVVYKWAISRSLT